MGLKMGRGKDRVEQEELEETQQLNADILNLKRKDNAKSNDR